MSVVLIVCLLLVYLFLSAVFSGSETGIYSVSRAQIDAEARAGHKSARVIRRLLENDSGLLITLLVGNNLMLELLTHTFEGELIPARIAGASREILVATLLTPVVFLFGELVAKDLFHRRPHRFLLLAAPMLAVARVIALPLALPLQGLSLLLERLFRLRRREMTRAFRRQEMLELLSEGTRSGALEPGAEALARNVLALRETPVAKVMVPWDRVRCVDLRAGEDAAREQVLTSEFTRLPALSEDGTVAGYVHQLDVLGDGGAVADSLRTIPRIDAVTPVDRALTRLRLSGQRLALVGSEASPEGLVTLMDLVAAIAWQRQGTPGDAA